MIDFASENNLPFQFTNGEGTHDASSDKFTSVDEFKTEVLKTSGARDLANTENTLRSPKAEAGSLILMKNGDSRKVNHTQVVTSANSSTIEIAQGNLNYRILSQDPSNPFYGGVQIQRGRHELKNGQYKNSTTGNNAAIDLKNFPKVQIRNWRYHKFNK
jgi:hypothetical protein